jgi:hypothetical protein
MGDLLPSSRFARPAPREGGLSPRSMGCARNKRRHVRGRDWRGARGGISGVAGNSTFSGRQTTESACSWSGWPALSRDGDTRQGRYKGLVRSVGDRSGGSLNDFVGAMKAFPLANSS